MPDEQLTPLGPIDVRGVALPPGEPERTGVALDIKAINTAIILVTSDALKLQRQLTAILCALGVTEAIEHAPIDQLVRAAAGSTIGRGEVRMLVRANAERTNSAATANVELAKVPILVSGNGPSLRAALAQLCTNLSTHTDAEIEADRKAADESTE